MKNIPIIYDRQFIMRQITMDDYMDYYFIGLSKDNTRYLTWGPFENVLQAQIMLENFYLNRPVEEAPAFAIEYSKSKEVIGMIEFHSYNKTLNQAEVGFILREDFHHRGIMTKALGYLLEYGFHTLNLDKVLIGHVDLNLDSKHLILKFPFHYEFTKHCAFRTKDTFELRNVIYYSLYKDEYERSNI